VIVLKKQFRLFYTFFSYALAKTETQTSPFVYINLIEVMLIRLFGLLKVAALKLKSFIIEMQSFKYNVPTSIIILSIIFILDLSSMHYIGSTIQLWRNITCINLCDVGVFVTKL